MGLIIFSFPEPQTPVISIILVYNHSIYCCNYIDQSLLFKYDPHNHIFSLRVQSKYIYFLTNRRIAYFSRLQKNV